MTSSLQGIPSIEKLKGCENYPTWKFAMQAYLEHEDMWGCIEGTDNDARKMAKAKSKIILCVDAINYSHIQSASTAKEVWDRLKTAFEDSGLTRKVSLLRTLVTAQLEKYNSVEEYVNEIMTTAHKLDGLGFNVPDEWVGTLMLAGLPDKYKPMIMGIESSGTAITADSIKTKLLQDVKDSKAGKNTNSQTAFLAKDKKKGPRCFKCNKHGHFANVCKSKPKQDSGGSSQKLEEKQSSSKNEKAFVALLSSLKTSNGHWYVDSCSSAHLTNQKIYLQDHKDCENIDITVANKEVISVKAIGNVKIPVVIDKGADEVVAKGVLYTPGSAANLLSVSKIVNKGLSVMFTPGDCYISDDEGIRLATMSEENGIYRLDTPREKVYFTAGTPNAELWHKRLGHLNYRSVIALSKNPTTKIKIESTETPMCVPCIKGKQQRQPFPHSKTRSKEILQMVHSDVCGPMENTSIGGLKYFLTFIDDFSRKTFVYFLKEKSQVKESFIEFKNLVENQTGKRIKVLRSDNGREYVNKDFERYMKESGIKHQLTITYTPQQNGVAERENRTIIERAKSMLFGAELPKTYWAEAVATAIYLGNRSPNSSVDGKMPEELWSGSIPSLAHLRVFGCAAYAHVPKELRQKLDPKGEELLFMGYCEDSKGYRLMDPKTKKVTRSRDVIFLENFKDMHRDNLGILKLDEDNRSKIKSPENEIKQKPEETRRKANQETDLETSSEYSDAEDAIGVEPVLQVTSLRRSARTHKPINMNDYVTYLTLSSNTTDPESVEEALNSPDNAKWIKAMEEEHEALVEHGTWELVDLPKDKRALDTKWVFKVKRDSTG